MNYPRTSVYDDAQVNVLEEALPLKMNNKSKRIKRDKINPKCRSYDFEYSSILVESSIKIYVFCRIKGHDVIKCPQIDIEVKGGFVKHVGQQMLNRDFVEQPQMRKQVHNSLENKLQKTGLSEAQFIQNRLKMHNSPSVSRTKPFFVSPNFI